MPINKWTSNLDLESGFHLYIHIYESLCNRQQVNQVGTIEGQAVSWMVIEVVITS
jgi:hypothetical protein